MTNKEIAQSIRKVLREKGYSSKDISVRSQYVGYSSRFDVTIKNPHIRVSEIEKFVKSFESIDYCQRTGEILAGGNDYVFVKYQDGIFDEIVAELLPIAEKVFNNEKYSGHAIVSSEQKRVHINILNQFESILTEFDDEKENVYAGNYYIKSTYDLAVAMWRFKNVGTIFS